MQLWYYAHIRMKTEKKHCMTFTNTILGMRLDVDGGYLLHPSRRWRPLPQILISKSTERLPGSLLRFG